MISEVKNKMSKISLQFHATIKDIYEFVNNLLQKETYYNVCGVILNPNFELEDISIASGINDFKRYDMIIISKEKIIYGDDYNEFICKQDNNLGITIGCKVGDVLKESTIWTNAENEISKDWKKIINAYKKSLLKGAWVVNPSTKAKVYYKDHKYTVNAKLAYEEGIKICPIAGWNIYELSNEQNMQ